MPGSTPVSYTHLDVYKRQGYAIVGWGVLDYAGNRFAPVDFGAVCTAVSYTHLNIRALETATGVDLIIDDTPEAITLSSFDQTRREVARMTLERLIGDGRIHPARIEETVEKCRHDLELKMKREGERAVMELGSHGLHPDLIKLIGRLKYRLSLIHI